MQNHATTGAVFTELNVFLWLFSNPGLESSIFRFKLPDFLYIAPYSRKQREDFVRKGLFYKLLVVYSWIVVVMICPVMIYSIIYGDISQSILCIVEAFVAFIMVYSGLFLEYIAKVNFKTSFFIGGVRFFGYIMFVGSSDFQIQTGDTPLAIAIRNSVVENIVDGVIFFIMLILGIGVIVVCRRNYLELMVCYLADYELSHEIGEKR